MNKCLKGMGFKGSEKKNEKILFLQGSMRHIIDLEHGTLTIQQSEMADAGTYKCVANTTGQSLVESQGAYLHVKSRSTDRWWRGDYLEALNDHTLFIEQWRALWRPLHLDTHELKFKGVLWCILNKFMLASIIFSWYEKTCIQDSSDHFFLIQIKFITVVFYMI